MRDDDLNDTISVLAAVGVGFGLGRLTSGDRTGFGMFCREGFIATRKVTIRRSPDGNWFFTPFRTQLPGRDPVTVEWSLSGKLLEEGWAFDPEKGILIANNDGQFRDFRRPSPGLFTVEAVNSIPQAEFKYSVNLLLDGRPEFSIDPPIKNGPWS